MTDFQKQLQELINQAAEKEYPDIMGISQGSYRETFKQGCALLMPVLMKAVEQRNQNAYGYPEDENKELLNILKGEGK